MKTKKIQNKHETLERNIATWRDNRIFRKNNFPEKTQNYTIIEESPLEKDNFWTFFAKLRAVKKKIDDYLITSISVEKVMTKLSRPKKVSNLSWWWWSFPRKKVMKKMDGRTKAFSRFKMHECKKSKLEKNGRDVMLMMLF